MVIGKAPDQLGFSGWTRSRPPVHARGRVFMPGRFACVWAQKHGQPRDGFLVIFTAPANIADPGGEVGNGDEFVVQPREISDEFQTHHTGLAFATGNQFGQA